MHHDRVEVDELMLELANYKNDYADMAAERLLRKCSASWGACQYLQDRMHDASLPDYAWKQLATDNQKDPGANTSVPRTRLGV